MRYGLTKVHEIPHPHLNPLPEGEEITSPSRGGSGWGWASSVFLFLLLFLPSCGYHMAGTGSHLTAGVKTIFIPVFENKTMEPIIEEELTTAVIREFLKDGRIEVAESSRADMVLKGSVVSYKETPVSLTSDAEQDVLEYRVTVTTHLTLLDTNPLSIRERAGPVLREVEGVRVGTSGNPLWEQDITSTAEYTVSSDVMTTKIKKLSALREIARNLSEEVADRILLGW